MANNFETRFTAVDEVTPVADKVNAAFGRMDKRMQQLGDRMSKLGERSAKTKLDTPLDKFGKGAKVAADAVGQILPPFKLLTSVGSIAGLAMLAKAAGEFAMNAGLAAVNMQRASQYTNMTPQGLQELRGAAELKHIAPETVDAAMQNLYRQGEAARLNFDPEARAAYLTKVKPGAKGFPMKNGSVDPEALLYDLSNFISTTKLSADQQRRVLDKFGVTELRPLLEGGPASIDALRRRARENGAVLSQEDLKNRSDVADTGADLVQGTKGAVSGAYSSVLRDTKVQGQNFDRAMTRIGDALDFFGGGSFDPNQGPGQIQSPDLIRRVQEMSDRLTGYGRTGVRTLSGIAGAEGFPDAAGAAADLSRMTGINPEAPINLGDPATQATLISALRKERGEYAPEPSQLVEAIRQAISNSTMRIQVDVNGPARVRVTDGQGNAIPARINTTSPSAVGQ